MIKKEIKYTDLNGEASVKDAYFDLNESELVGLEFTTPGGFKAHLERITKEQDRQEIYRLFKEILINAYGEKSPDGKYFMKVDENGRSLGELFQYSPAFNVLFMELIQNEDTMATFINGIVPKNMGDGAAEANRQTVAPMA